VYWIVKDSKRFMTRDFSSCWLTLHHHRDNNRLGCQHSSCRYQKDS